MTPLKNAARQECFINSDLPHFLTNATNNNTFQNVVVLKIFKKKYLETVGTFTPFKIVQMSTHSGLNITENTLKNLNYFLKPFKVSHKHK